MSPFYFIDSFLNTPTPHVAFLGHADAAGSELYVEKHRYKILYKQVHIAGVALREMRLLKIRIVSGI